MKILAKILCISLSILMIFSLVGCGNSTDVEGVKDSVAYASKKSEDLVELYFENIIKGNFNGSTSYYDLPENSIISDTDIQWLTERGELSSLIGTNYEVSNVSVVENKESALATVTVTDKENENKKETKMISLTRKEDNTWSVVAPADFVNYSMLMPKGVGLFIGDKELVPISNSVADESFEEYRLYCVAKKTTFTAKTEKFGAFQKEILPCNTSEPEVFFLNFTNSDIANTLLAQTQSDINQICAKYESGTLDRVSLGEFFDESVTSDKLDALLSEIKQGHKASTGTFTSIVASDIQRTPNQYIYMGENDVISVNFTLKYTKVHSVSILGVKYPEEVNFIKYKLQEDGTWKIVECGEELFHCDEWGDISCGGIGGNGYYDGSFEPVV